MILLATCRFIRPSASRGRSPPRTSRPPAPCRTGRRQGSGQFARPSWLMNSSAVTSWVSSLSRLSAASAGSPTAARAPRHAGCLRNGPKDLDVSLGGDPYLDGVGHGRNQFARKTLSQLYFAVRREAILNLFVEESQDIGRVLDSLIRINEGGTPLRFSDLLMSIMSAAVMIKDADDVPGQHLLVVVVTERRPGGDRGGGSPSGTSSTTGAQTHKRFGCFPQRSAALGIALWDSRGLRFKTCPFGGPLRRGRMD
jgi:hypothetical protein